MYNKRTVGAQGEKMAMKFLEQHGYEILERNFYCRYGEIDIIAKHEGYLVFIEVKYRSNLKNGLPSEAVHVRKQRSIVNSARYYLYKNRYQTEMPCRFDVISILGDSIHLYQNAFEA